MSPTIFTQSYTITVLAQIAFFTFIIGTFSDIAHCCISPPTPLQPSPSFIAAHPTTINQRSSCVFGVFTALGMNDAIIDDKKKIISHNHKSLYFNQIYLGSYGISL